MRNYKKCHNVAMPPALPKPDPCTSTVVLPSTANDVAERLLTRGTCTLPLVLEPLFVSKSGPNRSDAIGTLLESCSTASTGKLV